MNSNPTSSLPAPPADWRPLLLVLALTFAVFAGVIGHDFVHFDDNINIYDNPHLKGLDAGSLHWMLTDVGYARRYMPIGWLSYAVDRQFFGLSPRSYHVGNLLFHLVNTALVFVLLRRLLATGRSAGSRDSWIQWGAAAGALLWAINPLRVENVAWASSRIYLVALMFVLFWLLAWLKSKDPQVPAPRRRIFFWLSIIAYIASVLTYPLAIFAPVLLFALEVFPLRGAGVRLGDWFGTGSGKFWRDKLPFLFLAFLGLGLTIWARTAGGQFNKPIALEQFSVIARVEQAFYVWGHYFWKPWVPFDLAPIYPTLLAGKISGGLAAFSVALVVGATGALFACRRRWPALWVLWICHLVLLVPFLGLSEYNHTAADRYSYLHGLLWAVAIAFGVHRAAELWKPRLIGVAVAGVALVFSLFTWQQSQVWSNTITLHRQLLSRLGEHPNRARFDEVLAVHYLRAGMTNEALASFSDAIRYERQRPDRSVVDEGVLPRAYGVMGDILASLGQADTAIENYKLAVDAKPSYTVAWVNMGILHARLGRLQDARKCFEETLKFEPNDAGTHHNLAITLKNLGETELAEQHFAQAKRLAEVQMER